MSSANQRRLAVGVALAAFCAFFLYYQVNNDHFDRLARARQIAVYGDVPFRDFFDPGYFLTLYASALMERLFGDNLIGEMLLNVAAMTAGTVLVFVLATRASGSLLWGLFGAGLVVLAEPRGYDYDKVFFFPLGLWACWRYVDRQTVASLVSLAAVIVVAGLFRYDSAVYLGGTAILTLTVVHANDWRLAGQRLATFALAVVIFAAPALVLIQMTAGLGDAFAQVVTYAKREGARSAIFRMSRFDLDWSLPVFAPDPTQPEVSLWADERLVWFPGFLRESNAAAWLHWLALTAPALIVLLVPLRRANRNRTTLARALSCAILLEFIALFILRDPVRARVGGVMPIVAIGAGLLIGEWRAGMKAPGSTSAAKAARQITLTVVAAVPCLLTVAGLWGLFAYPPWSNLNVSKRLAEFAQVPPSLSMIPRIDEQRPIALYIRACTKPADRLLEPWFAGELYFFSGRGFAAGLPVVFGDHWSEKEYQRRAVQLLERENVPIILRHSAEIEGSYPLVWQYVADHYELARTTSFAPMSNVEVWVKRGLAPTSAYGTHGLPCYAP